MNERSIATLVLSLLLACLCCGDIASAAVAVGCMNLRFSETLGDSMVLQREPESAAVYGSFETTLSDAEVHRISVSVTIVEADGDVESYRRTVQADRTFSHSFPNTDPEIDASAIRYFKFKALLPPRPAGGDYTITATCNTDSGPSLGNPSLGSPAVSDEITASLRDVTYGDVWYCGGQSNMQLRLKFTVKRNESIAALQSGKYSNIRFFSDGRPDDKQPWTTAMNALRNDVFLRYSSTCWYFAESLVDELERTQQEVPPIGLVHTAIGGSTIEDWLDDDTLSLCSNACKQNQGGLFYMLVEPFMDMTIKGWIWYQGENNSAARTCQHGNYLRRSGYACFIVELVSSWRALWSATPGTTNPLAPFGVVAIPESGRLGGSDIGTLRWAQTAGYGVLPNPAMPNTFLVQAYDQDDPYFSLERWGACDMNKCRQIYSESTCGDECDARCGGYCLNASATPILIGTFHPRTKKGIGARLGRAAAISVYGNNNKATTGPTLAGCSLGLGGHLITVLFNRTLMVDDVVRVQNYDRNRDGFSKMEVLVDPSQFCMHRINGVCIDDGYGNSYDKPGKPNFGWVSVDIAEDKTRSDTVVVDLTKSGGVAHAIRYVWHGTCCNNEPFPDDLSTDHCPLGSCPIVGGVSDLPANPFVAKIVDGRCSCIPPQVCDADPFQTSQ